MSVKRNVTVPDGAAPGHEGTVVAEGLHRAFGL
jgi:hypothetical protein